MDILTIDHISFTYPESRHRTIEDLSFALPAGSFSCLIGPSGSGKSTLFRLINGLLTPEKGSIRVSDVAVRPGKSFCGSMQKTDLLFPWRTVGENLLIPLMQDETATDAERQLAVSAALIGIGLPGIQEMKPDELDKVSRKKTAFARALLSGGNLLLLDDPFSDLDSDERAEMERFLLEQWKATGKTIFLITDDVREAVYLGERVCILSGTPANALREEKVPLGYPRSTDMLESPEILALRSKLLESIAL